MTAEQKNIIDTVAKAFGVKPNELMKKENSHKLTLQRRVAWFFLKKKLKMTYAQIAELFWLKNHGPVNQGVAAMIARAKRERDLFDGIGNINAFLKANDLEQERE